MKNKESKTASVLCLPWVAAIGLAILKLTGQISSSWWLVTAPVWLPAVLYLSLVAALGLAYLYNRHR